jgi:hypothetical protein
MSVATLIGSGMSKPGFRLSVQSERLNARRRAFLCRISIQQQNGSACLDSERDIADAASVNKGHEQVMNHHKH